MSSIETKIEYPSKSEAHEYMVNNYFLKCDNIVISTANSDGPMICRNKGGWSYYYMYYNEPSYCKTSVLVKHDKTRDFSDEDLSHICDWKGESDLIGQDTKTCKRNRKPNYRRANTREFIFLPGSNSIGCKRFGT